jgi:hypothetical protein
VGKHDPERQRAIDVQLEEMGLTIKEAVQGAIIIADNELAYDIAEDYYLHRRADEIRLLIQWLGLTPSQWARSQPYSVETSKIHSILEDDSR